MINRVLPGVKGGAYLISQLARWEYHNFNCFLCAPWSVEGRFQGCQLVGFWHGTCHSCCMFLLSETLYSSVKYFKNIYKIIIRSDAIVIPRAADAYTVWHGHNKSAHHKATWAQLTCTGVGGRTCLGLRAAGSQSAFFDSSGQLLDLLGYTMKHPPDAALSVELSFSLGHRDCRSQTQSIWSTSNG